MPQLEAYRQGRHILLAFKNDIFAILAQACENSEAITFAKAAQILRKQMLNVKSPVLEKDIAKTTPPALLLFV
jgi:hypothetical protein